MIGQPLAESEFLFELFADVAGENLVLLQALDHFLVQRGQLANLVFQNFFDVILAEFAQVFEADEPFAVQVGQFLLDKLEEATAESIPRSFRCSATSVFCKSDRPMVRLQFGSSGFLPN